MDYAVEDRLALRRARAAEESARRQTAGEYPFTLLEATQAIGLDAPVSHDDLIAVARVLQQWNIRTNVDAMLARDLAAADQQIARRS